MLNITEGEIVQLAHIVNTQYLPVLKEDAYKAKEPDKNLLSQRYLELHRIVTKVLK